MARRASAKSNPALDPALPQKKRARRRLVGAAAVCLAAAIVLPLLLDTEPRQIRDDVDVRIPSRDAPLSEGVGLPARSGSDEAGAGNATRGAARGESGREVQGAVSPAAGAAPAPAAPPANAPGSATDADVAADVSGGAQAAAAPEPKHAPKPAAVADPIGKLAEAKDPAKARPGGYVVQIGAFASERSASEQIERARKAGFKAYRETVKTAQGERVRVRIGPFASRDAADHARTKLHAAGVESVLVAP